VKRFFEHSDTLPYIEAYIEAMREVKKKYEAGEFEVIYLVEGGERHNTYILSAHKTKDEAIEAAMRRASRGSDDEVFSVIAYLVGVEQVLYNHFEVWNYYWDVKRRRNE
jgi:hypothetical protein